MMEKDIFKHLNNVQLDELIFDYYNSKDSIKKIMEKYRVEGIRSSDLYKYFPPEESEIEFCEYCNVNLEKKRLSRSNSQWSFKVRDNIFQCPNCGHSLSETCMCNRCKEKRRVIEEEKAEKKRTFLNKHLNKDDNDICYSELSFKQKVYLGAFLRCGISHDYNSISPIRHFDERLTPSSETSKMIFEELYFSGVIKIDPLKATLSMFTVDYENDSFTFLYEEVPTYLNINDKIERNDTIKRLLNHPGLIENDHDSDSAVELWKEIIYWECLELYKFRLEAYGFEYRIGKKTEDFFRTLINEMPISQIYSIIWNGAKNSAAYYQEGRVNRRQAANSTLTRMRGTRDRIMAGHWDVNNYNRPKDCPQSSISAYFFDTVIRLSYKAWEEIPSSMLINSVSEEGKRK